jgi:cytochrome P450
VPPALPEALTWPSPGLIERPYTFYEQLRHEQPIWRSPATGEFLVSRWADIVAVAKDAATFGQYGAGPGANGMAATDDPEHRAKRLAAQPLVSHRSLHSYGERVRALSNELVDDLAGRRRVAFVADYARVFSTQALCAVLGFPEADTRLFVEWFGAPDANPSRLVSDREVAATAERMSASAAYVEAALLDRLRTSRDDVLSGWLRRIEASPWRALEYLSNEILFLFFAGCLPVAHVLTAAVACLLQHPSALARVAADRSLLRAVVEEALRLDPPIQWLNRVAKRDTEIAGVEIPVGATVVLLWGSGTRDETIFEHPAEFRLDRPEQAPTQLAFGRGTHLCLGAPLVRLQSLVALGTLLAWLARAQLATPPVDYRVERTPVEIELDVS